MGSKYIKPKGPAYTVSYKRPFNNKKRTRGRQQQVLAEVAWIDLNKRLKRLQDESKELHGDQED